MKDRTFNAVSQRILPGRPAGHRWDGQRSFGFALAGVRVAEGGAEVAVLCPDARPPVPVQWP